MSKFSGAYEINDGYARAGMTTEKMDYGLDLSVYLIEVARDHAIFEAQRTQCSTAITAVRAEHAQRVTMQHHAADLAQRVADLEVERDELRARLAEIEAQEPVAISKGGSLFWSGNPQDWRVVDCKLYARPVPAQAAPDGWRLVPVEPKMEMLQAALMASRAKGPISGNMEFSLPVCHELSAAELVYRAMIAAAPEHKA